MNDYNTNYQSTVILIWDQNGKYSSSIIIIHNDGNTRVRVREFMEYVGNFMISAALSTE